MDNRKIVNYKSTFHSSFLTLFLAHSAIDLIKQFETSSRNLFLSVSKIIFLYVFLNLIVIFVLKKIQYIMKTKTKQICNVVYLPVT